MATQTAPASRGSETPVDSANVCNRAATCRSGPVLVSHRLVGEWTDAIRPAWLPFSCNNPAGSPFKVRIAGPPHAPAHPPNPSPAAAALATSEDPPDPGTNLRNK